ncbi:MAG TPA: hypothetical protein VFP05_19275 [Thermomicrobiales bacterium]|nr:hypothetical protein [Thermomicrobiales bacterium]
MSEPFQFDHVMSRRTLLKVAGGMALPVAGAIAAFFVKRQLEDRFSDPENLIALTISPVPISPSYAEPLSNRMIMAVPPTPTSPLDVQPPGEAPTTVSGAPPGQNLGLQHTISFANRGSATQNDLTGSIDVHMANPGFELALFAVDSGESTIPQEFVLTESRVAAHGKHYTFQLSYLPAGKRREVSVFANAPAWAIRIDGHSNTIDFRYPDTASALHG